MERIILEKDRGEAHIDELNITELLREGKQEFMDQDGNIYLITKQK